LSRIGLTWSASPAAGGIVLHDSLRSAGLDIGQRVSFEDHREWRDSNGTLLKSEVWTFSRRIDGFYNATSGSAITGGASFLPSAEWDSIWASRVGSANSQYCAPAASPSAASGVSSSSRRPSSPSSRR